MIKSSNEDYYQYLPNAIIIVAWIFFAGLFIGGCAKICGFFAESSEVLQEEAGPRALLRKYEWFKDTAAKLSALDANIRVYEVRIHEFDDVSRNDMDRHDKAELNQIKSERAGMVLAYNNLAAEYNAAMVKINYKFCNVGDLPEGADTVLPREYRAYMTDEISH